MAKYLISFPAEAMVVPEAELPVVAAESRAVIEEAKAAGIYVFAAGIDEAVAPLRVGADGAVSAGTYPGSRLTGGFTILELPDRAAAVHWAGKLAAACRCAQEVRVFMYDPLT